MFSIKKMCLILNIHLRTIYLYKQNVDNGLGQDKLLASEK